MVITSFDGLPFLAEAVRSVLTQADVDLECLVVDDASNDGTRERLEQLDDHRLTIVRNEVNLGPFGSANRALERCTGELIARLDADDRCAPHRLASQARFLAAHPHVGLVGSECERIDEAGRSLGVQPVPESDLAIRLRCLVAPPFIHSSVMWRRSLGLRYDPSLRLAGDYELWIRALATTQAANLAVPLVQYRVWNRSLSARYALEQRRLHDELAARWTALQWPEVNADASTIRALREWSAGPRDQPLTPAAHALVAALRASVLGAEPSVDAVEAFARSLFTPPGAYGQPAPTA